MAGEIIREMAARLGLDVDENAFELADGLLDAVKGGLAAFGAAAGAATLALAGMVGKTVAQAGRLDDLAARTGLNVEMLQRLGHAAGLGGVELETLAQGLNFASRKGVKDLPKFLADTADRVQALNARGQESAAVALVMERFGRGGAALLPIFKDGGAALQELLAEADALGLVMGEDLVAAGDELGDNFDRIKGAAAGVMYQISAELIPSLVELTRAGLAWWKANRADVMRSVINGYRALARAAVFLWTYGLRPIGLGLRWVIDNWKLLAVVVGSMATAALIANAAAVASAVTWYAALGIGAVVAAVKAAAAWAVALWPVVALGAAIALVILIAEDLWTTFNGGEGVIYGLLEAWTRFWDSFLAEEADDHWITATLKEWFRGLADLEGSWDRIVKFIRSTGEQLASWLMTLFLELGPKVLEGVRAGAKGLLSVIPGGSLISGQLFDSGGASSPAAAAALQTSAQPRARGAGDLNVGGMTIVQQPGENGDELAKRVRWELDSFWETKNREAAEQLGEVP